MMAILGPYYIPNNCYSEKLNSINKKSINKLRIKYNMDILDLTEEIKNLKFNGLTLNLDER